MSNPQDIINAFSELLKSENSDAVSFVEFATSPEYMGMTDIFPFWKEELADINSDINLYILKGSLGGGKSTISVIVALYSIYLLFSQNGGNVQKTLGLMAGSDVFFLYFAPTLTTARKTGFGLMRNFIDSSPWFKKNFPRDKDIDSEIRFSNGFQILPASKEGHQIGLNVWGFVLDESNFRKGVGSGTEEEYSEVFMLAQQLRNRQEVRFTRGGELNAVAIYVSSASYNTSFIEDISTANANNPRAKIVTAVQYKIRPDQHSKIMFDVFCGFNQFSPCLIKNKEHKESIISQMALPKGMEDGYFESVPVNLKSTFEQNIYLAIQNICGRSTSVKGTFITNPDIVHACYTIKQEDTPLKQNSIVISNLDDYEIRDIVDFDKFQHTDRPHSVFLDLNLSGDEGSISIVRYDGLNASGQKHHTHVCTIELLAPEFPAQTRIAKVITFILELADYVNLTSFGSDQFQSTVIRQEIQDKLRLPDIRISLDSTDMPFLLWVSALVDKRFDMVMYDRQKREIFEAVHDVRKRRVVKAKNSSDDQFQSLVGAFFLSETVSSDAGTLENIVGTRTNIIGKAAFMKMTRGLGFV